MAKEVNMEFESWSNYIKDKPIDERLRELYYASERRTRNAIDSCRNGIGEENKRYYDSEEKAQGQRADFLYENILHEYQLLEAIVNDEEYFREHPEERNDSHEHLDFLYKLKERKCCLECAYGCEFYKYTCGGNPYDNPGCPSFIIKNEKGEEINVKEFLS